MSEESITTEETPDPHEISENDPVSLTQEEINAVKTIIAQKTQLTSRLGVLHMQQLEMKRAETQLIDGIRDTERVEQELVAKLNEKYGTGTLDYETGLFTPTQ